ncbi:MAG TPA: CHASE domain-containing protein [Gemmatimonadales bacterium]|nr:CHASE domain-containing protein [Gemmatimonadales bacterium]
MSGRTVRNALTLAAAYYLTGRLGLVLAIPPGYATPLWPPAGVALAALLIWGRQLWPGVMLGSFAVNIGTSFDPSTGWASLTSLLPPAVIAGGAGLQAWTGALLVDRFVGRPLELVHPASVIRFFLVGGPAACLINATIGVGTLFLTGSIRSEQISYSWWTWWVGDAIGVAVVAPLLLVWFGEPRAVWRRRNLSVAAPLGVTAALVVGLFTWVTRLEETRMRLEFEKYADNGVAAIRAKVEGALQLLESFAAIFAATPEARRAPVFADFARRNLAINPGVQALSWNPRVTAGGRDVFEQRARASYPGFRIVERTAGGALVPAPRRDEYVVVLHIEPAESNAAARGFNVESEPLRRATLRRACETARPAGTPPTQLVQETAGRQGMLVFLPVYSGGGPPERPADRCGRVLGYVTGVFRLHEVMRAGLAGAAHPDIAVALTEDSSAEGPLRTTLSRASPLGLPGTLSRAATIAVAGQTWRVVSTAKPSYRLTAGTWRPWFALAGGMLFTALLGALLLIATGNALVVERLGTQRLAELSQANELLQREIVERTQMEARLRHSEAQLRQAQKMEAVGRLAGGVAHDFNNLLTAILGYGAIVRDSLPAAGSAREDMEEIIKAGQHAARLTQQLLAFSRKQVLQPRTLDLNEVVRRMEKMLRRLIRENVEIQLRTGDTQAWFRADPLQVEQVMMNLVVNASDSMPEGGTLTLEAGLVAQDAEPAARPDRIGPGGGPSGPSGPYVMLRVSDTGVGMDEETQSHIFEPFFTTKAQGKGTGLGLSTVYGIVQQSRGWITVDSRVGRGSTFTVYFPATAAEAESAVRPAAPARAAGSETILLVEDEDAVRTLARKALERRGYEVLEARHGEEGIDVSRNHGDRIDLVVTDIIMPRLGGPEMVERLRIERPELKVLYVSGYSPVAIEIHGVRGENSAFIAKPFTPDSLISGVQALLNSEPAE